MKIFIEQNKLFNVIVEIDAVKYLGKPLIDWLKLRKKQIEKYLLKAKKQIRSHAL